MTTVSQPTSELGRIWDWFADTSCRVYSPLYDRICRAAARDEEVLDLVRAAPEEAHLPNVLLAAVHFLLLNGLDHPLAAVYSGSSAADPWPRFREICFAHRAEIAALMETRRTNTNECGRSAVIGPALTWVASRFGSPLAICDVGASAGLNMGCDRYLLDYGPAGTTGPASSAVRIECAVTGGTPPIAPALPPITARLGLDRSPVDLADRRRRDVVARVHLARHRPPRPHPRRDPRRAAAPADHPARRHGGRRVRDPRRAPARRDRLRADDLGRRVPLTGGPRRLRSRARSCRPRPPGRVDLRRGTQRGARVRRARGPDARHRGEHPRRDRLRRRRGTGHAARLRASARFVDRLDRRLSPRMPARGSGRARLANPAPAGRREEHRRRARRSQDPTRRAACRSRC